ncbi:hypothetical protein NKH77_08135 [Streptomyces sp. M19]
MFALGASLAFAATGRPPFGEGTFSTVSYRTVHGDIDLEGVDPELAGMIRACADRDPARRPAPTRSWSSASRTSPWRTTPTTGGSPWPTPTRVSRRRVPFPPPGRRRGSAARGGPPGRDRRSLRASDRGGFTVAWGGFAVASGGRGGDRRRPRTGARHRGHGDTDRVRSDARQKREARLPARVALLVAAGVAAAATAVVLVLVLPEGDREKSAAPGRPSADTSQAASPTRRSRRTPRTTRRTRSRTAMRTSPRRRRGRSRHR